MTARDTIDQHSGSRYVRGERIKDEVYRQMFLLEESCPGSAMGLAVALLRAWIDADSKPAGNRGRGWLKKVSPICLEMIEASVKSALPAKPLRVAIQIWGILMPRRRRVRTSALLPAQGYTHIEAGYCMRPELIRATDLLRLNTPKAVEEAIGLLQNTVYSFSMKVCGHPEDAEDTMQEVLFRSLGHLAKINDPRALAVWLYTVTRNRCWRMRRKPSNAPTNILSLDELMPSDEELGMLLQDAGTGPEGKPAQRRAAPSAASGYPAHPGAFANRPGAPRYGGVDHRAGRADSRSEAGYSANSSSSGALERPQGDEPFAE